MALTLGDPRRDFAPVRLPRGIGSAAVAAKQDVYGVLRVSKQTTKGQLQERILLATAGWVLLLDDAGDVHRAAEVKNIESVFLQKNGMSPSAGGPYTILLKFVQSSREPSLLLYPRQDEVNRVDGDPMDAVEVVRLLNFLYRKSQRVPHGALQNLHVELLMDDVDVRSRPDIYGPFGKPSGYLDPKEKLQNTTTGLDFDEPADERELFAPDALDDVEEEREEDWRVPIQALIPQDTPARDLLTRTYPTPPAPDPECLVPQELMAMLAEPRPHVYRRRAPYIDHDAGGVDPLPAVKTIHVRIHRASPEPLAHRALPIDDRIPEPPDTDLARKYAQDLPPPEALSPNPPGRTFSPVPPPLAVAAEKILAGFSPPHRPPRAVSTSAPREGSDRDSANSFAQKVNVSVSRMTSSASCVSTLQPSEPSSPPPIAAGRPKTDSPRDPRRGTGSGEAVSAREAALAAELRTTKAEADELRKRVTQIERQLAMPPAHALTGSPYSHRIGSSPSWSSPPPAPRRIRTPPPPAVVAAAAAAESRPAPASGRAPDPPPPPTTRTEVVTESQGWEAPLTDRAPDSVVSSDWTPAWESTVAGSGRWFEPVNRTKRTRASGAGTTSSRSSKSSNYWRAFVNTWDHVRTAGGDQPSTTVTDTDWSSSVTSTATGSFVML
eukprot:TRINITY_DN39824_c0_g1_i1.p1 TRINITY_DN39824_c0_g1~~TRINITY_DN39824_c0_g1_i1.p1  ORF type:complete len:664 (+),score=143.34 TRINITY_DN39824_c0_g1_i1:34-2025(+)